jgi:hypothetical protein
MKFLPQLLSILGFDAMAVAGAARPVEGVPVLDQTPDHPVSFGFKTNWFAVRSDDAGQVIASLGLSEPQAANWNSGFNTLNERRLMPGGSKYVFVSPPVKGWVLVVGSQLPYPEGREGEARQKIDSSFQHMFGALSDVFPEVHFFGSYRVVDFVAWARARNGKIERVAAFADGDALANFGELTPEERSLGLFDVSGLSLKQAAMAIAVAREGTQSEQQHLVPREETPLRIAEAWGGIDPSKLEEAGLPKSAGILAVLPASLRH